MTPEEQRDRAELKRQQVERLKDMFILRRCGALDRDAVRQCARMAKLEWDIFNANAAAHAPY